MDTANAKLSNHLHEVLDVIGASEYTRKKYWELAMLCEIPSSFENQFFNKTSNKRSFYQIGSTCEGTTTLGLDSDVDIIYCDEDSPVVDNLVESKQHEQSYIILSDEFTQPGYVNLQSVKDKCPLSVGMSDASENSFLQLDWKGRICITHPAIVDYLHTSRNGPADTFPARKGIYQMDLVYALRCRNISRLAHTWLHRKRKYDWPSQKQLNAMGSYGCFLVGVGHPHSDNKSFEWRISFSLQERDLMSSLNETQHKCYILLKMIKKDIIESKVRESISSYHCKTSLFYTIENTQNHIWKNCNLILCVRMCLIRLSNWVKAKKCPNYFIQEENMFDKLSPMTLKEIENVLNDVIYSGVNFLYSITCDNVGELLKSKWCGSELVYSRKYTDTMIEKDHPISRVYMFNVEYVNGLRNGILRRIHITCTIQTDYMHRTKQLLLYLQNTNHITEHTTRDVRMALESVIPHIQLQYEQCMFAQFLSQEYESHLWPETIPNLIVETSSDCDLISSKLALASLYIQSEKLEEECKRILVSCENSLEPHVISVCSCVENALYFNHVLDKELQLTDMSFKDFIQNCTTDCMVFMPSQVSLVHKALQYELFRNVYTNPQSKYDMKRDYLLNWITVDSQIYLYFLQYLLYSKTEQLTERETAVNKLIHVMNTDLNLGHRETTFNLLGWVYLQENELPEAWRLFCLSWKSRPLRNAAKWHMRILLSAVIKGK